MPLGDAAIGSRSGVLFRNIFTRSNQSVGLGDKTEFSS